MERSFTAQEVVEMGIQIEINGRDFYSILAEKTDKPQAKAVFSFLADAERQHIFSFREIFETTCEYTREGEYPDEYFAYMNYLASQYVFTQKGKGREIAEKVKDYDEGLDSAIRFEKESVIFYKGVKKVVPADDKYIVDRLIAEEEAHLKQLCELKGVDFDEERRGL